MHFNGFSPLWFRFVSIIENEAEWTTVWMYLTSKGKRMRYSTELSKITSTVLLKCRKNDGIAVYFPKVTILEEMAAKIE
jgi:hypothetical protein